MFGTRVKEVVRRIQEVGGKSELLLALGLTQYINGMRSTELQKFLRWKDPPVLDRAVDLAAKEESRDRVARSTLFSVEVEPSSSRANPNATGSVRDPQIESGI